MSGFEALPWTSMAPAAGVGLTGGILSGLFGIGGGIVLIPLLGLLLGLDQHRAQGLTLAVMLLPNSLPAVLQYRRRGVTLQLPLVFCLMVGFLLGIASGARTAHLIPDLPLRVVFSVFLCLVALKMLRPATHANPDSTPGSLPWRRVWKAGLAIGLAGGFASGLLGIGGGIVIIPLLVAVLRLPQHEAQLASLALLLPPLGLPGVLVYARAHPEPWPWAILAFVALGFALGAHLGARVAVKLRGPQLTRAFAGLLLVLAVLVLRR